MNEWLIVLIVFVLILNIIFFVKVIEIANRTNTISYDLRKLKNHLTAPRNKDKAIQAYISGNKDIAKQYLELSLRNVLLYDAKNDSSKSPYKNCFQKTKSEYSDLYKEFHIPQPDWDKLKNKDFILNNNFNL